MKLSRYIAFAKRNIRRSPFQAMAASMVMFFTFFVLLTFILLGTGSQLVLKFYESKPQAIAFFKDGTKPEDVKAIQNALAGLEKVTKIKYVSKEEALKIYQKLNKNEPALLELVTANTLPASLEVSTQIPEDLEGVAQILRKEPVVEEVLVPEDVVQTLTTATSFIRIVGASVTIFLMFFATLVVLMIVGFKIRLRRDEIEIMRLVGATNTFIRAPFLMEGIFYGIVGAFSSWVIIYLLVWYFSPFLQGYLGEVQLMPVNPFFMLLLLGIGLFVAIIVGGLGSLGAVRRYLRI